MASLQLTAESAGDVAVRRGLALLVVLLRAGQGHAADAGQTARRHSTNESRLAVRVPATQLAQTSSPHEDTAPVGSVPIAHGPRTTVVVRGAEVSVAGLFQFHRERLLLNHVVHLQKEKTRVTNWLGENFPGTHLEKWLRSMVHSAMSAVT